VGYRRLPSSLRPLARSALASRNRVQRRYLGTLIDAGRTFAILSPNQAQRIRGIGGAEWRDAADGSINLGKPIATFNAMDPVARLRSFSMTIPWPARSHLKGALGSSRKLLDRLQMACGPDGAMVNVATDGETFGHHFPFGERCISHALKVKSRSRDFQIANYGEYLERHPALDEVEIKPGEGTAWSCVHGIGRWYRDCGCQNGGPDGRQQALARTAQTGV